MDAIANRPLLCPRCLGSTLYAEYEAYSGEADCILCEGAGYIPLRRFYFEIENRGLDPISYLLSTVAPNERRSDDDA